MRLFDMLGAGGLKKMEYDRAEQAMGPVTARPRTISETIGDQIAYHQRKLDDLKAAQKVLENTDVLAALEALQKLSF